MATFDNTVGTSDNFKGYTGNPPTTEAEYDALEMRYDDLINATTTGQDAIAAIKTEYPK